MAKPDTVLANMRKICLSLPDTKETLTWGEPHFRVGEKIFAGCGEADGRPVIGFKLERDHAHALVQDDPRFRRAPYVGHKGWVSMDATAVRDWDEVRPLVFESYGLIAPKRTLARMQGAAPTRAQKARKPPRRAASRRPAARRRPAPRAGVGRR